MASTSTSKAPIASTVYLKTLKRPSIKCPPSLFYSFILKINFITFLLYTFFNTASTLYLPSYICLNFKVTGLRYQQRLFKRVNKKNAHNLPLKIPTVKTLKNAPQKNRASLKRINAPYFILIYSNWLKRDTFLYCNEKSLSSANCKNFSLKFNCIMQIIQ